IGFQGAIFSDDLTMAGAHVMGDIDTRAKEALSAGCDMILCCNDPAATATILDRLPQHKNSEKSDRVKQMRSPSSQLSFEQLKNLPIWQQTQQTLEEIESLS
ncbi:MAG: beta-N-acetylhexosaminidase, partial [Gammaproteobacteria bacterium]